jgi:cell division protease FtsH
MNWADILIKALIWTGIPMVLLLVFVVVLIAIVALFLYFVVYKKAWKHVSEDFKKQSTEQKGWLDELRKNKAKEVKSQVTFKEVGGLAGVKEEIKEIIDFFKKPEKFKQVGARMPRGVLLYGPPGTGKSLLAKALAGEAGVKFFEVSGSEFNDSGLWGVGSSRVGNLFEELKKNAPCIIFFDEIDALGGKRSAMPFAGEKSAQEALNQLLTEMDGFEKNSGVMVFAATNRKDMLDPALTRKGRFDREIYVLPPDKASRKEILEIYLKKVKHDLNFDIEKAASDTFGCSGADLENMVNEAAILAVRKNKEELDMDDFVEANIKVQMGPARMERKFTEEQKRILAYHEAGHAIVAIKTDAPVNLGKVSIVSHGEAGGFNMIAPNEEKLIFSKKQFCSLIAMGLGGRAAEMIVFTDFSFGAREDIKKVTGIAKQMVSEWGMSDEIGPVNFSKDNFFMSAISGGQSSSGASHACSEITAQIIDKEIQKIVNNELERAMRLLNENREALDETAKLLIEKETMDGDEIKAILEKHKKSRKQGDKEEKQGDGKSRLQRLRNILIKVLK